MTSQCIERGRVPETRCGRGRLLDLVKILARCDQALLLIACQPPATVDLPVPSAGRNNVWVTDYDDLRTRGRGCRYRFERSSQFPRKLVLYFGFEGSNRTV